MNTEKIINIIADVLDDHHRDYAAAGVRPHDWTEEAARAALTALQSSGYILCQADTCVKGTPVSEPSVPLQSIDLADARKVAEAVAGCHDYPVIRGIFADLEAAFPGYLFELTQDFRVIVAKATNPQSPSEERSDTDSAEQPGSSLTQNKSWDSE